MRKPLLSIVMGIYNGADKLTDTVRSIMDQAIDFPIEIIVVNDGSTDESGHFLEDLAGIDQRLRVIHQSNAGLTKALIRGCAEAKGEYIARQDCGDISLSGRFVKQLDAMQSSPSLAFVSCISRFSTDGGDFLFESRGSSRAHTPLHIIDLSQDHGVLDGPSHHGSVMFRRSAYEKAGGYRSEFYYGQDWDLWYRLAEQGQFQMLPEVLYEARMGVTDISMNNKARQEVIGRQSLQALRLRMAGLSDQPAVDAAALIRPGNAGCGRARGSWRGCYFMGECLRRNGNRDAALHYLSRAVKENPLHLKSWVRLLQARFG